MLDFVHPSLLYENDLIMYRREVILAGGGFDGTAGLGNFKKIGEWLELIHAMEPEHAEKYGYYPTLVYLSFDGDALAGIFNVRLSDGELIRNGAGHIGYHVRPSMRRRGYAGQMLREAVSVCLMHGISEPVVCTDPGNLPSRRTALSCGFVYEGDAVLDSGIRVSRFVLR